MGLSAEWERENPPVFDPPIKEESTRYVWVCLGPDVAWKWVCA